ncbi:MAG: amidase [Chloroflexota bacterium]
MDDHTKPFTTLSTLAHELRSGKRPLIEFINELEQHFNQREPEVLAFVPENGRFDRLRHEADQLLADYPEPEKRPLLFGVPIGVKDIFHVDGFVTQAGSQLPSDILQGKEAECVTQLKQAGALILGKTVTTEFAYFAPGPTRNPHHPEHTPGGSSSGSAAAVGAGLAPLTFGTQTIGSINRPGAYCGAIGYKPSFDRISKRGVIPLASSVDHIGLFAADFTGLEMAASYLCSHWQPTISNKKPVFGIPEGPYLDYCTQEARLHFRQTCRRLHEAGFAVKSILALLDFEKIKDRHQLLVAAEAARFHATWRESYGELYHHKTVALFDKGKAVSTRRLNFALNGRLQLRDALTQLMQKQGIDVWLSPPAPGTAPKGLDSTGDPIMNLPWTHAGLPTVNLPTGKGQNGLPLGLQMTGRWYEDEALIGWGGIVAQALA